MEKSDTSSLQIFSFFCEYLWFCLQKEQLLNKHFSVLTPSTVFCVGKMKRAHKCLDKKKKNAPQALGFSQTLTDKHGSAGICLSLLQKHLHR